MTDGRWWIALATYERRGDEQEVLPEWAQGAVGWMAALAPDEETARQLIVRDLEYHDLRVLEIKDQQEVFSEEEIDEFDERLGANFRDIEPGRSTVWGTLHCYKGEGEA